MSLIMLRTQLIFRVNTKHIFRPFPSIRQQLYKFCTKIPQNPHKRRTKSFRVVFKRWIFISLIGVSLYFFFDPIVHAHTDFDHLVRLYVATGRVKHIEVIGKKAFATIFLESPIEEGFPDSFSIQLSFFFK